MPESYVTPSSSPREVAEEFGRIFETHFDRGWVATVLIRAGVDQQVVRQLRYSISSEALVHCSEESIAELASLARTFVGEVRELVMPSLYDHLGLNVDLTASMRSRDDFIHRRMVAYTLPHNLDRLESLVESLSKRLTAA